MGAEVLTFRADLWDLLVDTADQAFILEWFDRVLPGRYVLAAGLQREGRMAFDTIRRSAAGTVVILRGCDPSFLVTRMYVDEQPPEALVRACLAAAAG